MKKQRILSALLTLCLVFSLLPTALAVDADDFTDVGRDSWCYDYVDYVTSKGYFLGTTDTTFSPDRNMTRAMFVVVLARFDGVKVNNSRSSFTDVEPGAWCAGAIEWAADKEIVTGYADGTFKPNAPITRAQMCAIIARYLDYYTKKHDVTYSQKGKATTLVDQDQVPSYATAAVRTCQRYALINGYADGTFRPQAYSTRAHVAAIIYRLAMLEPVSGGGGGTTDHIRDAMKKTIDGINAKYLKGLNDAGRGYAKVEFTFNSKTVKVERGDEKINTRPQTVTINAFMDSGLVEDIIETATLTAIQLMQDVNPDEIDKDELKSEIRQIIDGIKEELAKHGVDDFSSLDAIAEDVYDELLKEGGAWWKNFRDVKNGLYYTGDIAISVINADVTNRQAKLDKKHNPVVDKTSKRPELDKTVEETVGETVTIKVDEENGETSMEASRRENVKAASKMAKAIAAEMYTSLKEYYRDEQAVNEIAEENGLHMKNPVMDADGYVSKVEMACTIRVTFSAPENDKYKSSVEKNPLEYPVTVKLVLDGKDLVKYKFDEDAGSYVKLVITENIKKAYVDSVDRIILSVLQQDEETQDALKAVIIQAMEDQGDEICDQLSEKMAAYCLGELTEESKAEIKAVLTDETVVDEWLNTEGNMAALYAALTSDTIGELDNSALFDPIWKIAKPYLPTKKTIEKWVGDVIHSQLYDDEDNRTFDIVEKVKENEHVKSLEQLGIYINTPEDINELMELKYQDFNGREFVYSEAKKELDSQFENSDYKDLYDSLSDVAKDYLISTALVELNLDFEKEQKAAKKAGALTDLLEIVGNEDLFQEKIDEKINDMLEDYISEIKDSLEEDEPTDEEQKYAELAARLQELKSGAIRTKKLSAVADLLRNETLQEKIGSRGDRYVAEYLGKAISKLPEGANITINGEKINKATLNDLANAETTVDALDALAEILDRFGDLCIADFENPDGIPVKVAYGSQSYEFHLVIAEE